MGTFRAMNADINLLYQEIEERNWRDVVSTTPLYHEENLERPDLYFRNREKELSQEPLPSPPKRSLMPSRGVSLIPSRRKTIVNQNTPMQVEIDNPKS